MPDHGDLGRLIRAVVPPMTVSEPARDLWPLLLQREQATWDLRWLDIGLAAVVGVVLVTAPGWLWFLLYHL